LARACNQSNWKA